ncbi:DUF3667 domain-containing protein [Sphingomonas qomolangmaensis]|uniref:DUF3667 domain-containing protein n=1 Tax=Sphingomonas qomolangmaensis TaxID=2918765 RepID=A0ABY5L5Y5_9SPHN|nr:DUF3667 domain-containing protein [Sphingomonas qomolangmaensis]UUL81877.1 DUF3667 domain-containing protein [Sphingomonas qomolangmaensis]
MGGDLSAAGDFATGALLARSVEPTRGEAHGGAPDLCLNCGTALVGAYCHACGQAGHVHRSLGAIWHEILHGVVHFEGKLWRTLPMLAFRPGELTRRYIDGERARFVSPMAGFLFSVFTLFTVMSILGIAPPADLGDARSQAAAGVVEVRKEMVAARQEAIAERDSRGSTPQERAAAITAIAELESEIRLVDSARPAFGDTDSPFDRIKTGWKRLDYGIEKARKNPGLMLYKLQANSYKFSWLLIPLSVPFLWLMFAWKRQYHAYDHAVFVTYSIAFMSLLFIVLTILGAIGVSMGVLGTIAMLVPPFHIYRQLRGAYRLRRSSALVRMLLLVLVFIQLVFGLFVALVLGLGLIG